MQERLPLTSQPPKIVGIPFFPMSIKLLCLLVVATGGMAVDQSKFRTCDQTSFCRRHRAQRSSSLYEYKIDVASVRFHLPSENDESQGMKQVQDSGGMWKSINRMLGTGGKDENERDPYFRGPPPTLTGMLVNKAAETSTGSQERLEWSMHAMEDGLFRVRITEVYQTEQTPYEKARVTYDDLVLTADNLSHAEHVRWIRPGQTDISEIVGTSEADKYMGLQYGDVEGEPGMFLLIRLDPFAVYLYREDEISTGPFIAMGDKDMLHFEIRRNKDATAGEPEETNDSKVDEQPNKEADPGKEIVGYWEDGLAIYADGTREERKFDAEDHHRKLTETGLDRDGMWEESFHAHKDSKPFGPTSVGMDVSFPNSKHLFGLPEHASSTLLKKTHGEGSDYSDPYRLYNLDVFEYDLDVPMALYGAVPLIVSQSATSGTSGVFWFNPSETFVDIVDDETRAGTSSHWISESGVIDAFLVPGPTPRDLYRQYARLTGKIPLPPIFSLGYHQCRWNYKDESDVYHVHGKFEELDYPYDVLWLDIEHTDGKRYFTWDSNLFPNPKEMQEKLWAQGRRMVTIIDPHVKRDDKYFIFKEAKARGLFMKDKEGKKDFDGWCWPGSSSYLDFTAEHVRSWWADQFAYDKYKGSTPSLFTWNDMNEFSVFNGPEVTGSKDLRNLRGDEHREWHNLYGMLFHRATGEGLIRRSNGESRPFVLSRSFFAGSQKYGAIWTGDNAAEWSHLQISSPMLLSLNVGALSFVGADVGGFFGNTDAELMTRWMQAGAYTPFFRGHAHHDAKRREPWMFGEETMIRLRKAALSRYALLPFWYTVFFEAGQSGMPVMRTMWMQYPKIESLYGVDDQYLIGDKLLVKPVTAPGVTETSVQFPTDDVWYDADNFGMVSSKGEANGVREVIVPSDIDVIPVFQRGGTIIPRKLWLRRSSHMMKTDPYTLYIALDEERKAQGSLYMDDEESFAHEERQEFAIASFEYESETISNYVTLGSGWEDVPEQMFADRLIERIVVMGLPRPPTDVSVDKRQLEFDYSSGHSALLIRKPQVSALKIWEIQITL